MTLSGTTSNSSICPPRSTIQICGATLPSCTDERISSRSCIPSTTLVLPTRRTTSPLRSPARSAAPPGMTSPMDGRVHGAITPIFLKSWASASRTSSTDRSITTTRGELLGVFCSSRRTRSPSRAPWVNTQRSSSNERIGTSSSSPVAARRTSSPPTKPALSATEPATGLDNTALGSCTPPQLTMEYSNTASSRLARGPAATIAARERNGWVLNARWRS